MDITSSLLSALTLLGLGMAFVFVFLGLLFFAINLIAKYLPAEPPLAGHEREAASSSCAAADSDSPSTEVVAAISVALQQYRKAQHVAQ